MPERTVISSRAMLFTELFKLGRFTVPWHQRYYDWNPDDVQSLLQDIHDAVIEERDCYFLGAIMLVEQGESHWEVNDGQQRMVTISLIYASLCRRFANQAHESQREGHALRMLFDLDANHTWILNASDQYTPRLAPPRNDSMQYRQIIRGNTIGSNGTLTAAWEQIEGFFLLMGIDKLERYFDFLQTKLEVACLWIPPHIDPNAVYETLNHRGKKLDDLDLIRNYIYSHFNSYNDFERKKTIHENLEKIRPVLVSSNRTSEYMRCHLQCRFGFLRKDRFYRDVREAIRDEVVGNNEMGLNRADYVYQLTEKITSGELLELFRTMTSTTPDVDFVRAFQVASRSTRSVRNLGVYLRELRGYKVTQPLVFAILSWYLHERNGSRKRRIAKIANLNLQRLATFVLRTAFVVPKFEPSHFETQFSNFAKYILNADDLPSNEFAEFLVNCDNSAFGVLDDSKFANSLSDVRMTGNTKIKQFLLGINADIQSDARLLDERYCTVEHVLSKSPQHWDKWSEFNHESASECIHRIGNLTLLGPEDNKPGPSFNGDFLVKREIYRESGVKLTREISLYEHWSPEVIGQRQNEMAEKAVKVWRFD